MAELDRMTSSTVERRLQPLTKAEIDQRLRWIGSVVTRPEGPGTVVVAEALRPRWITAAELVRRVRPFLSVN